MFLTGALKHRGNLTCVRELRSPAMSRKHLSDGWRAALLAAGAIDLIKDTSLEKYSQMEPGGLSLAEQTHRDSIVEAFVTCLHNRSVVYALTVRFWCLLLPDFMDTTSLAQLQKAGCELMSSSYAMKLGDKPQTPKDD